MQDLYKKNDLYKTITKPIWIIFSLYMKFNDLALTTKTLLASIDEFNSFRSILFSAAINWKLLVANSKQFLIKTDELNEMITMPTHLWFLVLIGLDAANEVGMSLR